jgi:hypothetical protein
MSANEPELSRENILGSRKTAGFVIMVLSILALVALVSKLHTPNEVAEAALYCIAIGGLFTMGGQALVDSVKNWRSGVQVSATTETTNVNRTIEVKQP